VILPPVVERPVAELGRFFLVLGRVMAWTPRPPYDWRELLRQMVRVGVESVPVILLTTMFTGAVMALQTFTVLAVQRREVRRLAGGTRAGPRAGGR
jgi:ABC-type transporter Mla maintaining outer membrane lipid asymmetry permease subunit MlaE